MRRLAAVLASLTVAGVVLVAPVTTVAAPSADGYGTQTILGGPVDQAAASGDITVKSSAGRGVIYKNISGGTFWCYPGWWRDQVRSWIPPAGYKASWSYAGEKRKYTATDSRWVVVQGSHIIWSVYPA